MVESSLRALQAAIDAFNREATQAAADALPITIRAMPAGAPAERIELCRTRPPDAAAPGGCAVDDACRDQIRLMTAAEEVNRAIRIARSAGVAAAVTIGPAKAAEQAGAVLLALAEATE